MIKLLVLPLLVFSIFARAGEVTLHFIPAPTFTNWSSPQKVAKSVLVNQFAKYNGGNRHEIGHLYVELTCGSTHILTGSTSQNNTEERRAIFIKGYGLGIVLKNFAGKLDAQEDVEQDINSLQSTGRSNFVKFLISESTCDRLTQYLDEYKARGYDQIYAGLNARPLYGESSGCTAFGMSFLELAGLQIPEFEKAWSHDLIMPRKFVGGPLTHRNVRFIRILTAFRSKWDTDLSNGGFPLHFWDPEQMVVWTNDVVKELNQGAIRTFPWPTKVVQSQNSYGLEFDARDVPTPTGPIFKVP